MADCSILGGLFFYPKNVKIVIDNCVELCYNWLGQLEKVVKIMQTIGERLLEYRAVNKISQAKLASKLCEHSNTISRAERGLPMHKCTEVRLNIEFNQLLESEHESEFLKEFEDKIRKGDVNGSGTTAL